MKYPDEKYENMLRWTLPTFLLLLCDRDLSEAVKESTLSENEFVQTIETFLFQFINIADPETMDGRYDMDEYFKRRLEFLHSLGLTDYIKKALLVSSGNSPAMVGPN